MKRLMFCTLNGIIVCEEDQDDLGSSGCLGYTVVWCHRENMSAKTFSGFQTLLDNLTS